MITLRYEPVFTYVIGEDNYADEVLTEVLTTIQETGEKCLYDKNHRRFLSGLCDFIISKLREYNIEHTVLYKPYPDLDYREPPKDLLATEDEPDFKFREYQPKAIAKLLVSVRGLLQIGTGGGKTEIYIGFLKWLEIVIGRKIYSLTMVSYSNLARQIVKRMSRRGLKSCVIAKNGDISNINARHVVAVVNTIHSGLIRKKSKVLGILKRVDVVGVDESHRALSSQYREILMSTVAKYRIGLSATQFNNPTDPYKNHKDLMLIGLLGPILVDIPSVYLRRSIDPDTGKTFLPDPKIYMIPCPLERRSYGYRVKGKWIDKSKWHVVEKECIITNPYRVELTKRLVFWTCVQNKFDCRFLIIVAKKYHGILLQRVLHSCLIKSVCSFGGDVLCKIDDDGTFYKEKDYNDESIRDFENGKFPVLIDSMSKGV